MKVAVFWGQIKKKEIESNEGKRSDKTDRVVDYKILTITRVLKLYPYVQPKNEKHGDLSIRP